MSKLNKVLKEILLKWDSDDVADALENEFISGCLHEETFEIKSPISDDAADGIYCSGCNKRLTSLTRYHQ